MKGKVIEGDGRYRWMGNGAFDSDGVEKAKEKER